MSLLNQVDTIGSRFQAASAYVRGGLNPSRAASILGDTFGASNQFADAAPFNFEKKNQGNTFNRVG